MDIGHSFDNQGQSNTIAASYLSSLLDFGVHQGLDRDDMLSRINLESSFIEPPSRRLASHYLFDLFDVIERAIKRPDIGLLFGLQIKPGAYSALGYATMSCSTLVEAINLIPIYESIVLGFSQTSVQFEDGVCRISWQPLISEEVPRAMYDAILTGWAFLASWMTGSDITFRKVSFVLDPPTSLNEYQDFFQCPLEYKANCNSLEFDGKFLSLPLQHSNSEIHQLTRRHADDLLQQLPNQGSVSLKVSECLQKLLARQQCRQQDVCKELGVTERSLRRYLKKEGTSFRKLLLENRQRLATIYLADDHLNIIDVALLLGFAEHSSFSRAFKDWGGISPDQWRQKKKV